MSKLEMKYFVLKPRSKFKGDPYAAASRKAMRAYARGIYSTDEEMSCELLSWAANEQERDFYLPEKEVIK